MTSFISRNALALIIFLGIGGYFLWTEHSAHAALAIPYLPWILLLACPLVHLFMHGGHGHGGHGGGGRGRDSHGGHSAGQRSAGAPESDLQSNTAAGPSGGDLKIGDRHD